MAKYDYVIVGAGISGAALAYFLKKGGAARVLLLERGDAASGGTGKSAAIVRQHYSTRLMARLARRSVELFRAMPEDLGQDGGYRGGAFAVGDSMTLADCALLTGLFFVAALLPALGRNESFAGLPTIATYFPQGAAQPAAARVLGEMQVELQKMRG